MLNFKLVAVLVLCAVALVWLNGCGPAFRATSPDAPQCAPNWNTVRLVTRDPNPYTNEEFAACGMPADAAEVGLVYCCPYETARGTDAGVVAP